MSKREFCLWAVALALTSACGFLLRVSMWSSSSAIATLVNSINAISFVFALGLPVFLTLGLMFATSTSRAYIQFLHNQGRSHRDIIVLRFLQSLLLIGLYSVLLTGITFLEPYVRALAYRHSVESDFLIYLPSVLIASFLVSCMLAAIAMVVTLATDSAAISTVLGCTTTLAFSVVFGWNAQVLGSSLNRGLAQLSPHNLVKAIAALLSGYDFTFENQEIMYFGFGLSSQNTILSLVGFLSVALIALALAIPILGMNMSNWPLLHNMVKTSDIWARMPTDAEPKMVDKAKQTLSIRRGVVVVLVASLLLSVISGNMVYTQNIQDSTHIIHYESAEDGEVVHLQSWVVIGFELGPPYPGLSNVLNYHVRIIDWGSCPDILWFHWGLLAITPGEFDHLNESSKLDQCHDRNETRGEWGGTSAYVDFGEEFGSYILVFRAVSTDNPAINGSLRMSFYILQRAG